LNYFEPFNSYIELEKMKLDPEGELIIRRLSDVVGILSGHLQHCISIVYPGKIGNEYYMTKGHFHKINETSEIYLTLKGRGKLVMQTPDQKLKVLDMKEGSISYIPPYWAHRTVNIGDEPLIFFGVYRGDAGHDYGIIEEKGMAKIVIERNKNTVVLNNSNYLK